MPMCDAGKWDGPNHPFVAGPQHPFYCGVCGCGKNGVQHDVCFQCVVEGCANPYYFMGACFDHITEAKRLFYLGWRPNVTQEHMVVPRKKKTWFQRWFGLGLGPTELSARGGV